MHFLSFTNSISAHSPHTCTYTHMKIYMYSYTYSSSDPYKSIHTYTTYMIQLSFTMTNRTWEKMSMKSRLYGSNFLSTPNSAADWSKSTTKKNNPHQTCKLHYFGLFNPSKITNSIQTVVNNN